jgi:hypothetical protein
MDYRNEKNVRDKLEPRRVSIIDKRGESTLFASPCRPCQIKRNFTIHSINFGIAMSRESVYDGGRQVRLPGPD